MEENEKSLKDKFLKGANIKDSVVNIKNYFVEMPKPKRNKIIIIAAIILLVIIAITLFLNIGSKKYKVLYQNIDKEEAGTIYADLQEMGVEPQLNKAGEVMVPKDKYDQCLLQLAAKGYPKSALPYDVFASHSGLTTTETEKKQWLLYQLQDRIQSTLTRIDGVKNATVTITVPEKTDYVWDKVNNKDLATAAVLLDFKAGKTLGDDQITAIKNLVASSVPKMDAKNVTIVDSATMLELNVGADTANLGSGNNSNLQFEQTVQKQIEDNIRRILTPRYGADGVVAVAKVTLNYDKMLTEKNELVPNKDGDGYVSHTEGNYGLGNKKPNGGIAGEENNTDIPEYGFVGPNDGKPNDHPYSWLTDYQYGYIKTQIEKGNAILDKATVSVMVDDSSLTRQEKEELTEIVSKSADVPTEFIVVSSFVSENQSQGKQKGFFEKVPMWAYIVLAATLIIIIALVVLIIIVKRKRKNDNEQELLDMQAQIDEEQMKLQAEIDDYKKQLADMASSPDDAKENAIMTEVRDFAKANPEITANLLRSWLKEDE